MQLRPGNGAVALTAGLALAVMLGPFVLRGDPATNARLTANRDQIAKMTEADRLRLERNFTRWNSLSAADQRRWREFAAALDQNRASLGPVFSDYYDWLQTIPGYRRDELRQATSVQAKVDLVREIADDQLTDRIDAASDPAFAIGGPNREFAGPLSSAELDVIMAVVEERLLKEETAKLVNRDGEELSGIDRRLAVLSLLLKRFQGPQRIARDADFQTRIRDAFPERLEDIHERLRGPQGRERYWFLIMLSIRDELEREIRGLKSQPDKLRQFYEQDLPAAEREPLLSLSANEFLTEVSRLYFWQQYDARVGLPVAVELEGWRRMSFGGRPGLDRGSQPRFPGPGNGPRPFAGEGGPGPLGGRPGEGFRGPPNGDRGFDGPPDGDRPPREGDRPQVERESPPPPRNGESR